MYCQSCGAYNPGDNLTCLNCRQPLPGRGAPASARCRNHPDLAAAGTCHRCGTFFCSNCVRPIGTGWLCEDCVQKASTLAWDERESVGMWRAFWRTSVAMISHPIQTLTMARADAPLGSSILYSVLALVAGMGPTLAIYAGIFGVVGATMPKSDLKLGMSAAFIPLAIIFYTVLLVILHVVGLLFNAGLDHIALLVMGAKPRAYAVSVRAGALAMGPYLLGLVPVCGLYVFPIWAIVLRIFAVMHLHNVSAGKATAAVLLPLLLLCGFCFASYAALIMAFGLSGR